MKYIKQWTERNPSTDEVEIYKLYDEDAHDRIVALEGIIADLVERIEAIESGVGPVNPVSGSKKLYNHDGEYIGTVVYETSHNGETNEVELEYHMINEETGEEEPVEIYLELVE